MCFLKLYGVSLVSDKRHLKRSLYQPLLLCEATMSKICVRISHWFYTLCTPPELLRRIGAIEQMNLHKPSELHPLEV